LAERAPDDREDLGDVAIEQALAQHALTHHAARAKRIRLHFRSLMARAALAASHEPPRPLALRRRYSSDDASTSGTLAFVAIAMLACGGPAEGTDAGRPMRGAGLGRWRASASSARLPSTIER